MTITNSDLKMYSFGNNNQVKQSSDNVKQSESSNQSNNSSNSTSLTPREEPFIKPFDKDAFIDEWWIAMQELHEAYYINSVEENLKFGDPEAHINRKYNAPWYPYYVEGLSDSERDYAKNMEMRYLEGERNVPVSGLDGMTNAIYNSSNAEHDHEEKVYQRELLDNQFKEMLDFHGIEIPKDVRLSFTINKESNEIKVTGTDDENLAKAIESIFSKDDISNIFDHIAHTTNSKHSSTLSIEYQNGSFLEVGQKDKLISNSDSYSSLGIIDSIIAEDRFNELLKDGGITVPENVKLRFDIDPSTDFINVLNEFGILKPKGFDIEVELSSDRMSVRISVSANFNKYDLNDLEDIFKETEPSNLVKYLILQQEDNKHTIEKHNFVKDIEELTGYDLQNMLIENGSIVTPKKESLVDILKDNIRNNVSIPLWAKEKQIDSYSSKLEQLALDGLDSISNLTLYIEYENGSFISRNQNNDDKNSATSKLDVYV